MSDVVAGLGFVRECQRCGRTFIANHANEKLCNLPSLLPEDGGRTCKMMRRIESKREERSRGKALKASIASGQTVVTDQFGCISSSEYINIFTRHLMEKYNLKDYAAYQRWRRDNSTLVGEEYAEFQVKTGLHLIEK